MAKITQGILGPYIGKLGPTVGYLWRGRAMVRAHVRHIQFPNTERQLAERDWFVSMVRFAAAMRPALRLGFRQQAERAGMFETNWFVKTNKRHFSRLDDGTVHVDYRRLALSAGPVAPATPTSATVAADGVLTVRFDPNRGLRRSKGDDAVHLTVCHAGLGLAVCAAAVRRREGVVALRLPDGWAGAELHCYLFATDGHGDASATGYLQATPITYSTTEPFADADTPAEASPGNAHAAPAERTQGADAPAAAGSPGTAAAAGAVNREGVSSRPPSL